MKNTTRTVALVGKLGHGKTFLLNKLTGTRFPSVPCARTCTDHVQFGYTHNKDILVLDTPGFYSSEDVAKHIAAQKMALEGIPLSGVYVVAKFGRADEIAEEASRTMNFLGDDDIRLIITHADTVSRPDKYDPQDLLTRLTSLLNIPKQNIYVAGKDTSAQDLEIFVESTLHDPKPFEITDEQIASISSLHMINRKLNKPIEEIVSKIAAASKACREVIKSGVKSYETDVAIQTTQSATTTMVAAEKEKIFRDTEEQGLTDDQKNLVYGKAGLALSLRLKDFVDSSNKLLSWDVTDVSDPRNDYRKCNYCGAVFNKTEGCDGETTCGAVPRSEKRGRPQLLAEFHRVDGLSQSHWTVQYFWDGVEVLVQTIPTRLKDFYARHTVVVNRGANDNHTKLPGSLFESGCGATIAWSTMLPVDPKLIQTLGDVEIPRAGPRELSSKTLFEEQLRHHEEVNRASILQAREE